MAFCTWLWFYNGIKKMGKRQKKMIHFWGKKQKKKNSVIIMISVDSKETVFPVKLELAWELPEKKY